MCTLVRAAGYQNLSKNTSTLQKGTEKRWFRKKCSEKYEFRKKHFCAKNINFKKIHEAINEFLPSKEKEQLASKPIKDICDKKYDPKEESNEVRLSQERGQPLRIKLNSSESTHNQQVSVEDFSKISTSLDLSSNKSHTLAKAFRVATKNRNTFKPHLNEKLQKLNSSLNSLFKYKSCNISNVKKSV